MTVAGNNIQQELKDVNNLWRWPTEYATYSAAYPTTYIAPEFWKWKSRVSYNGYLDVGGKDEKCGTFMRSSMMTKNPTNYSLGCFIDLQPGLYSFSCDASPIESCVWVIEYQLMPDGTYLYAKVQKQVKFSEHCKTSFTIQPNTVVCLKLGPSASTSQYTTFTNIRIQ